MGLHSKLTVVSSVLDSELKINKIDLPRQDFKPQIQKNLKYKTFTEHVKSRDNLLSCFSLIDERNGTNN
jgi:hypothetical protein